MRTIFLTFFFTTGRSFLYERFLSFPPAMRIAGRLRERRAFSVESIFVALESSINSTSSSVSTFWNLCKSGLNSRVALSMDSLSTPSSVAVSAAVSMFSVLCTPFNLKSPRSNNLFTLFLRFTFIESPSLYMPSTFSFVLKYNTLGIIFWAFASFLKFLSS